MQSQYCIPLTLHPIPNIVHKEFTIVEIDNLLANVNPSRQYTFPVYADKQDEFTAINVIETYKLLDMKKKLEK